MTWFTDRVSELEITGAMNFRRTTDSTALHIPTSIVYRRCAECKFWYTEQRWFNYYEGSNKWSSYCKPCEVNRGKKRDYKAERRALKERAFIAVGDICEMCGEGRKPVLDFHHKDPEFAKTQRDEKWNKRRRWYYVISHPREFEVLCKNCHYLRHHPYGNPVTG